MKPRKTLESLRSHRWFGPDDMRSFGHRCRTKGMGLADDDFRGKPVIGILNTWSDLNTCHSHLRQRADEVKRGVWQAGGWPVEVPVMSLGEMLMKPTTMMYRNLLAMEAEEVLRCHPIDGVVLMGGCDKTTPGLLMGAISMNLPSIYLPCGPMLKGRWRDKELGSGTDNWKYWDERRAGNLCDAAWCEIENGMARSAGHCMTMGTASTMTSVADAMGMTLTGGSSIPAVMADHQRLATASGRRIVDMVWEDLKILDILTPAAFKNGIVTDLAIGGSTNAIVHLIAMARRAGVSLSLDDFDALSQTTPVIANIRPAGKYLMPDFHDAGGLRALLDRIREHLDVTTTTVTGRTLGEELDGAEVYDDDIILPLDRPLSKSGGTYVLRGNLAPDGCVIKPIAADPRLLKHTGPAVVFRDYNDMHERLNDERLGITADSVIVLQSAGPLGAPGFPEWGMLPIPERLLKAGVRDMVRISDARMSGTSYGACVLHVAPETFVGGPIALLRDGDQIELDVSARTINVVLSAEELARRRSEWNPPEPKYTRGYGQLYSRHITQAPDGCDFDFLHHGEETPDPEIH